MKEHILAALREQFDAWEELLASLREEQITTPHFLDWSIKDVIAHLWAWQQISVARMESGAGSRTRIPQWVRAWARLGGGPDRINALTFESNHTKTWSEVYQNWRNGFLRFLELGNGISERDLLDGDRYPWLKGYSLAFILVASYDHHQEHLEKLMDWLREPGD
jgi:hypothetical protein